VSPVDAILADFASMPIETLAAISKSLAEVPQNGSAWTYTIKGFDGSPYITRTLLPRIAGHRVMLHHIHRADSDRWLHNHPWREAAFRVVGGGYTEERLVDGQIVTTTLRAGDVNRLTHDTFHRVIAIEPNTWTVGVIGDRMQDWGFLVGDRVVPHAEYFASKGYVQPGGGAS
jgi:hypothetical protein